MLVCNVSLRPPRTAIAADIAESTAAVDATATGNVVFATLVDDPASVGDLVDAYLGEIMLEAAAASDIIDVGLAYAAAVDEAVAAADAQDAVIPAGVTWDPATVLETTLSNGNLTATHATANANTGARATVTKTGGKYYFEITRTSGIASTCLGLVTAAGTYGNVLAGTNCTIAFSSSGNISSNNAASGKNIGAIAAGNVVGVAVDLTARKAWFRKGAAGNWNGLVIGSENPDTGLGGVVMAPTVGFMPVVGFGPGTAGADVYTANFGASAFIGAVPSGFTSGWPL
jgi:hypothetical protein